MSMTVEPIVVQWDASVALGLPEFNLTLPEDISGGTLEVYRVPSTEGTGGYTYGAYFTETGNPIQRPGCEAELMTLLFTATVSGSMSGMSSGEGEDAAAGQALVVSYAHPDLGYTGEIAGDVSGADPIDPVVEG